MDGLAGHSLCRLELGFFLLLFSFSFDWTSIVIVTWPPASSGIFTGFWASSAFFSSWS